jgi:hypothetical protein
MRDFIDKQVRRVNRNYLIAAALLLSVPAIAAVFSYDWAYNVLAGPLPIQANELARSGGPSGVPRNYLRVLEDRPALDTGAREGTKKAGITTKWLLLPVADRLLLVQAPIGQEGKEHVGYLAAISAASDRDLVKQLTYDYRGQFVALACLVAPVLLGGLWVLGVYVRRLLAPASHPVLRALGPYGDPQEVRKQIEADFQGATLRIGRLQLTHDWLLGVKLWGLDVARVEEVVWIYKQVIKGQGASISAVICTSQGKTFGIQGKDKEVDNMLKVIAECVPWALAGYDPGLEKLWSSDPKRVAEVVAERRRQAQDGPNRDRTENS